MHGKSNEPLIIVDADALISFVSINDTNHNRAKQILEQLAETSSLLLYPTTAICEAVTALKAKLNRPDDAKRIVEKLNEGHYAIQSVDQRILRNATELYNPHSSKNIMVPENWTGK